MSTSRVSRGTVKEGSRHASVQVRARSGRASVCQSWTLILDHQWDVFVGMSVEFDAWREERICWISLQISRYLSILERSEHDVAYTRMIRSAKLSVAMRSTGRKEIDVVSSQVAGGAKLCLRYDRHTTRHIVTLLPSRFLDQVVLRNPITTPLQPTRSFTPC